MHSTMPLGVSQEAAGSSATTRLSECHGRLLWGLLPLMKRTVSLAVQLRHAGAAARAQEHLLAPGRAAREVATGSSAWLRDGHTRTPHAHAQGGSGSARAAQGRPTHNGEQQLLRWLTWHQRSRRGRTGAWVGARDPIPGPQPGQGLYAPAPAWACITVRWYVCCREVEEGAHRFAGARPPALLACVLVHPTVDHQW